MNGYGLSAEELEIALTTFSDAYSKLHRMRVEVPKTGLRYIWAVLTFGPVNDVIEV